MMEFFGGFNSHKLKSNLKMASQRITLVNNKMDNAVKKNKKQIAKLLEVGKVEKARIKVEHVIRDDFTIEAHELIELLCETVVARLPLLIAEKECPFDMVNAVSTLIYVARRVQVPELVQVRKQLVKKYGKEFGQRAERNVDACVNERILHKLSVQPPNAFLVINYLKEIAKQYGVRWQPEEHPPAMPRGPGDGGDGGSGGGGGMNMMAPVPTPVGFSVQPGAATGFANLYQPAAHGAQPRAPGQQQVQYPPQQQEALGPGGAGADDYAMGYSAGVASVVAPPAPDLKIPGGSLGGHGISGLPSMGPMGPSDDVPTAQFYDDQADVPSHTVVARPVEPPSHHPEVDVGLPMPPGALGSFGPGMGAGDIPTAPSSSAASVVTPFAAPPAPDQGQPATQPPSQSGGADEMPGFEELQARFARLRDLK